MDADYRDNVASFPWITATVRERDLTIMVQVSRQSHILKYTAIVRLINIYNDAPLAHTEIYSHSQINLVIDNFFYVASDTSPLYKIWKQSDHYLWR